MKKISYLLIFFILFFNTSLLSDEKLVGKMLYCDSKKIFYENYNKNPNTFLDVAIMFINPHQAFVHLFSYLPWSKDDPSLFVFDYDLRYPRIKYSSNLYEINFDSKELNFLKDFSINRETLILKNWQLESQCRIINLDKDIENGIRFKNEMRKLAFEKRDKHEADTISKNKI